MEDFKNLYISEAGELIHSLESKILDLESNTGNSDIINEIFRIMHTLKGSSNMFGFDSIGELTHKLESIYEMVRDKEIKLNNKIIQITFQSVDYIRKILNNQGQLDAKVSDNHIKILDQIDKLGILVTQNEEVSLEESMRYIPKDDANVQTFQILFRPNENLLVRGINLYELFKDLAELGKYEIVSHMDFASSNDSKQDETWSVFLATDQGIEAIEYIFMFIMNDCEIFKISDNNLFNKKEIHENLEPTYRLKIINDDDKIKENTYKENQKEENTLNPENFSEPEPINNTAISRNMEVDEEYITKDQLLNENTNSENDIKKITKQITSRINVEAHKLDKLMNLVSELVTLNSQLNLINNKKEYEKLSLVSEKIENLSRQFRDNMLSIRLIPIDNLVVRFRRLIRDLSGSLGKEIKFITHGTDTELDKNIIDCLAEPILHIVRNAIDHGIEDSKTRKEKGKPIEGVIKLSSYHSGPHVFIQIQDDGSGLDYEKIKKKAIEKELITHVENLSKKELLCFVFLPGFSTSENITEISGRGVGLDVVKQKISELQGEISVDSEPGLGTIFTIKLQQTISIIDSLLVRVDNSYFLIPNSEIEFCIQEYHDKLMESMDQKIEFKEDLLPTIYLRKLFSYSNNAPVKEKLVVVNKNNIKIGIVVDDIIGEHQAVNKPLGSAFQTQDFLMGASIMGDGNLAFMLDINKLIIKYNNKYNYAYGNTK